MLVDSRGVTEGHVIGIEHVLDLQLPVPGIYVPMHPGIERELAIRRAVDEVVDIALHGADVILEARAFGGEAGEHESAVLADARRTREPEILLVEIRSATLGHWDRGQAAIGIEAPAVIAAGQPCCIAAPFIGHLGAAMGAAIEQHVDFAVAMADHDDGLSAEFGRDVVTRLRHLARMSDV